jgi:hypothetical protein
MHHAELFSRRLGWLVVLALATIAAGPPTAGGQTPVEKIQAIPDLVALWDFSEAPGADRVSSVGGYALAELSGLIARYDGGPLSGYSAWLPGNNYFYIPNADTGDLNIFGPTAQVTVVAWVERAFKSGSAEFVAGMWDEVAAKRQYGLFLDLPAYGGTDQVCGHVSQSGGPTPGYPYSKDYSANVTPVPLGEWQTVGFTYDGEYARSYLNGIFEPRPTGGPEGEAKNPYYFPYGLGDNGSVFTVGGLPSIGNHFVGAIGGVAVFSRALSEQEMVLLHEAGNYPEPPPPPWFFENFNHTTGQNTPPNHIGWSAHYDTTAIDSSATNNRWFLASGSGAGRSGIGFLADIPSPSATIGIGWTTKPGLIATDMIAELTFWLNNNQEADKVRVAVQIDGLWYASEQEFGVTGDGRVFNNWSTAEKKTFEWTHDASAWRSLTFIPEQTLSLAGGTLQEDLPQGTITAFGFYSGVNAGAVRIDDFSILLVPEPSVGVSLLGLAWLGLFRRRRRDVGHVPPSAAPGESSSPGLR